MALGKKNRVAEKVKTRLNDFEKKQADAKRFKKTKKATNDRERWILAWRKQCEFFDGWLKPAVRVGAEYHVERHELESNSGDLYSMTARSFSVPPIRIDILPLAGVYEYGSRRATISSPKGLYTIFWKPESETWTIGKEVEVEAEFPGASTGRKKAPPVKAMIIQWQVNALTRDEFEKVIEELL